MRLPLITLAIQVWTVSAFINVPITYSNGVTRLRASLSKNLLKSYGNNFHRILYSAPESSNDGIQENGGSDSRTDDDEVIDISQRDWRAFRKSLIAQERKEEGAKGWKRGRWAHEIPQIEKGCVLLAHESLQGIFWQSVCVILEHGEKGSMGVVLNRPTTHTVSRLDGLGGGVTETFGKSPIYYGGPVGMGSMVVLHSHPVEGSELIMPGLHAGGLPALAALAKRGEIDASQVRFEHGHAGWEPGQLQQELDTGVWYIAAVAPELIVAPCVGLPVPLWIQVLRLMGGKYQKVTEKL